jgi:hypothetical protein
LQRTDLGGLVVPPSARATAVADLLDLPLCSDVAEGRVTSFGEDAEVLAAVLGTLRQNGCDDPPLRWVEHDELLVDPGSAQVVLLEDSAGSL